MLDQLYRSSRDLYNRFDVTVEPETARRVFHEECYEALAASVDLVWNDESYLATEQRDALAEEIVDVIYTAIGLALAHSIPLFALSNAIEHVLEKNAAKTTDTHYVASNGKITRK